jgi:hypothetical protein
MSERDMLVWLGDNIDGCGRRLWLLCNYHNC